MAESTPGHRYGGPNEGGVEKRAPGEIFQPPSKESIRREKERMAREEGQREVVEVEDESEEMEEGDSEDGGGEKDFGK